MQFGTTNAGKPSAKLNNGTGATKGWRKYLKIRMTALFEAQGFSDTEIGFALGITPQYVRMLKNTPEYVAAKVTAATNVLSQAEKDALKNIEARHQVMADMVPDALHAIRDTLLNSSNPALRLKAAQDILDREGTLAKVSRTEVSLPKDHDYSQHEKVTNNLLAALQKVNAPKQPEQAQKLAEDNLAEGSEEIAGIEDFVNADTANLNEEQQKLMQDAMDLVSKATDKELGEKSKYIN